MSEDYYLGFSYVPGIGSVKFAKLIQNFKTVEKAYEASRSNLIPVLGIKLTDAFIAFRKSFDIKETKKTLASQDIQVISQNDPDYPAHLLSIYDPPICLYIKGNRTLLHTEETRLFAIVGTRKATSYGLTVTQTIGTHLADYGFTIVSGMALGIDSAAHWSALHSKGKTIAVLGGGVDIIYPPSNDKLYHSILQSGGAIISEFPPGQLALKGLFVSRNRIISGLCSATLVVEGDEKSGALITAKCALDQGKDVYAIPGPITSFLSWAPNMLIKQGAIVVTGIDDILQNFNISMKKDDIVSILESVAGLEKNIIALLLKEPLSTDEITVLLNISVTEILHTLSMLELKGLIKKTIEGSFMIL